MRIVFWQNCLSPHQLPYMANLLDDDRIDNVVIIADEAISESRRKMGWNVPKIDGLDRCEIYISPMTQTVDFLLNDRQDDSYHLFSGIRGYKFVYESFKRSLKYNIKRALITEAPNTFAFGMANGKPIWLHHIRFYIQDRKYVKYIHSVFAIGDESTKYYRKISDKWNIYPFSYCVNINNYSITSRLIGNANFVFIGSLNWWKSVKTILKADRTLNSYKYRCKIALVGDGKERQKLTNFTLKNNLENVNFLGTKKNSEISNILGSNDILILPSIYDGWGAVINEALMNGLYIICSNRCGAKDLLRDKECGIVFEAGNYFQLASIMKDCINNIDVIRKQRLLRQEWAQKCISGKVIAKYMIDCISGVDVNRPWINNIE
jgi:glycosyltransferase involved in cell wall biosynthesis